jgi:transcriptional regulator with XRE-family HTH domain
VRKLRNECGLGLRELAEIVGMSPAYLSMVERNELAPPAEDKVVALAESLEQDADEMLAIAGRIASDLPEIIARNPREMAALVRSTRGLSANKIESLMKQVRKLKGR